MDSTTQCFASHRCVPAQHLVLGRLLGVEVEVALQVGRRSEALAALVAGEGLLKSVDAEVIREAAGVYEAPRALAAGEGLLPKVRLEVLRQVTLAAEAGAALRAPVRLADPGVYGADVLDQGAVHFESARAKRAAEGPLAGVHPAVVLQGAGAGARLAAVGAAQLAGRGCVGCCGDLVVRRRIKTMLPFLRNNF